MAGFEPINLPSLGLHSHLSANMLCSRLDGYFINDFTRGFLACPTSYLDVGHAKIGKFFDQQIDMLNKIIVDYTVTVKFLLNNPSDSLKWNLRKFKYGNDIKSHHARDYYPINKGYQKKKDKKANKKTRM